MTLPTLAEGQVWQSKWARLLILDIHERGVYYTSTLSTSTRDTMFATRSAFIGWVKTAKAQLIQSHARLLPPGL